MNLKKTIILLVHPFIIWLLCGSTIGLGSLLMSMNAVLIIHAIMAPVFAIFVSLVYFKKFNFTAPFKTALIFLLFVMVFDAGLVAPFFVKSYDMFRSILGTWLPFMLIFLATFLTGLITNRRKKHIN